MVLIAVLTAALLLIAVMVWIAPRMRRVLLGWYIREVRIVEVAEIPGEAIVTYPLA